MLGQEHILDALHDAHRRNIVHHAYLFVGPDGLGQEEIATWFAQMVNCEDPDAAPCGACHQCRLIRAGNHPNVLWAWRQTKAESDKQGLGVGSFQRYVEARQKGLNGQILINAARFIRTLVNKIPATGKRHVIAITDVYRMEAESASVLLKTLEEPPEHAIIILLANDSTAVLPTILSRCQVQRFLPVSHDKIAVWLIGRGVPESEAAKLAVLCDGRPAEAERLRSDPLALPGREVALDWLEDLTRAQIGDSLRLAERLRTTSAEMPGDMDSRLHWISLWYRDVMATQATGVEAIKYHPDRSRAIAIAARAYPASLPPTAIEAIGRARRHLAGNANTALIAENLVMNLMPTRGGA